MSVKTYIYVAHLRRLFVLIRRRQNYTSSYIVINSILNLLNIVTTVANKQNVKVCVNILNICGMTIAYP